MLPPDLALALLINRTGQAYTASAPAYIAYTEHTHITATIGRSQDINRSVIVRNADNFAVMRDLPNGGENVGQAFPIIPYFDPLGGFNFGYFVGPKKVDINLERGSPGYYPIAPPDPSVALVMPYFSYFAPSYAPDSTESAPHILNVALGRYKGLYFSDIQVDPQTQLPSHITMIDTESDMTIALDYKVIDGHWTIVHGKFSATQHVMMLGSFKVSADVHYDDITFPAAATDPRLMGTPTPKP